MESIKLGTRATIKAAPPLEATKLLALAKERAPDAAVFDQRSPFFWQVRASSNRLDFYDTRMRPATTLVNFARALGEGVSYQDSHSSWKNGWGQSLKGYLVDTNETDAAIGDAITEVWGDLFTLPGLTLAGQSTDSFIDAVRAGIWRDVSVGFYANDIECSLCGMQSFQWWKEDGCSHIPGNTYKVKGEDVRAFAWINDGELVELSQVYKGASPSAAVVKAQQMSDAGKLPDQERAFIERRHGVRLVEPAPKWALPCGVAAERKDRTMDEQELTIAADERDQIASALQRAASLKIALPGDGAPLSDRVVALVDQVVRIDAERATLTDEIAELTTARTADQTELARLKPLAEEGVAFRAQVVDDAIAAGARAFGASFNEDTYRGILARLDLDGIRAMRDDFTRTGDAALAGGRRTREQADDATREGDGEIDPARHRG
jgi:hypothetical protein